MKKILPLIMTVLLLSTCFGMASFAAGDSAYRPDLVITKAAPDTTDTDTYEAFEIVNTSGAALNLYDYSMFYNGNAKTHKNYGKMMRLTPFKAGDIRDGSTWTMDTMPNNPAEFVMKPGEIVVVRPITNEVVKANTSEADFRAYWKLADSVRVVNWDANSEEEDGGNGKNFPIKNSGPAVYGIAKSEGLVEGESLYADGEAYSIIQFGEDPIPDKSEADSLVIFGYNGSAEMKTLAYTKDGVKLGELTSDQQKSLAAFMTAETADGLAVTATATGIHVTVSGTFGAKDWVGIYKKGETTDPGNGGVSSIIWWYLDTDAAKDVTYPGDAAPDFVKANDDRLDCLADGKKGGALVPGDYYAVVLENDGYTPKSGYETVSFTVPAAQSSDPGTSDQPAQPDIPQSGDVSVAAVAVLSVTALAAFVLIRRRLAGARG